MASACLWSNTHIRFVVVWLKASLTQDQLSPEWPLNPLLNTDAHSYVRVNTCGCLSNFDLDDLDSSSLNFSGYVQNNTGVKISVKICELKENISPLKFRGTIQSHLMKQSFNSVCIHIQILLWNCTNLQMYITMWERKHRKQRTRKVKTYQLPSQSSLSDTLCSGVNET